MRLTLLRTVLFSALLLASIAAAQPVTYFVPISQRTVPGTGSAPAPTIVLPDPGVGADQSILFNTSQGVATPFLLGSLAATSLSGVPTPAAAVAAAPGVLVKGRSRTLVAVVSGSAVRFGTLEGGVFVARGPTVTLPGSAPIGLSARADGGATLLVSDSTGTTLTRWEIDASGDIAVAFQRGSGGVSVVNDPAQALYLDDQAGFAYAGTSLGNLVLLNPALDAGVGTVVDSAQTGQGRLAAPINGLDLYGGTAQAAYLLVSNAQGLTIYDLNSANARASAFRVIAQDSFGSITAPSGVVVTNLPAGARQPQGAIALGDPAQRGLALLSWETLATKVDGGLSTDTTFDPRGP
ncbi:MAG TPA: hypothetical protein VLQ79_09220, partial [Myxococcaceae bacterium]|nr:hypothetical protein [Myxococcaceae bacterium]